jgi:hypothetical protein
MKTQIKPLKIGTKAAIVLLLFIAQSCSNYYKVADTPKDAAKPEKVIAADWQRYFILRTGKDAFAMNEVKLSEDKRSLTCILDSLPDEHKLHLHNGRGGHMRYKKDEPEAAVLDEIHLFVPQDPTAVVGNSYTLELDKVQKIEVLEQDKKRTRRSHVFGGLAIAAGVTVVLFAVAAIALSSGWNWNQTSTDVNYHF